MGQHFYIENLLEELDFPREFHFRLPNLYYMPADDETVVDGQLKIRSNSSRNGPTGAAHDDGAWVEPAVVVPVLEQVLRVQGTLAQPVRHLAFEGFTFSHSTTTVRS